MGKVVNLRQVRKKNMRKERREHADENAVRFGRTKAQKQLEQTRIDRAEQDLDGHELDE